MEIRRPAARVRWFAAAAFVLLVLESLAYWPGLERPGHAPREFVLLAGIPLLVALGLAARRARAPWPFALLVALAAASGLAHAFVATPAERWTVARDLAVLAAPWLAALAVVWVRPDARERGGFDAWIEAGAIVAVAVTATIGLAQAWWGFDGIAQTKPPAATFMNRNLAAETLAVLVPLVVPALLAAPRPAVRWLAGLAAGLGGAFLIATRSRGAWLGLATGLALGAIVVWTHALRRGDRLRGWAPAASALGLAGIALLVPVAEAAQGPRSLADTVGSLSRPMEGSGQVRLALWSNGVALLADAPFGVGPGRFAVAYPPYQQARRPTPQFGVEFQPEHAHGDLLEYAIELGAPGALALAALLVSAVALAWRRAASAPSTLALLRTCAAAAGVTAALVSAAVGFPLHVPASACFTWLLAGRLWAEVASPAGERAKRRRLAVIAALALVLPGAWVGWREIRAQSALARALEAFSQRACAVALPAAAEATRLASWQRREAGIAAMLHFQCGGEPARTLELLERALSLQPHRLELLLAVGARRLKAGDPMASAEAFTHAGSILPSHARTWLGLAMARLELDDREAAAAACRRALDLDPALEPARVFCVGNALVGSPVPR